MQAIRVWQVLAGVLLVLAVAVVATTAQVVPATADSPGVEEPVPAATATATEEILPYVPVEPPVPPGGSAESPLTSGQGDDARPGDTP